MIRELPLLLPQHAGVAALSTAEVLLAGLPWAVALQMRVTIKAVFPDRDVSVMVRPALTEADLQKLDQLPSSSLRPEFKRVSGLQLCGHSGHAACLWLFLNSFNQ